MSIYTSSIILTSQTVTYKHDRLYYLNITKSLHTNKSGHAQNCSTRFGSWSLFTYSLAANTGPGQFIGYLLLVFAASASAGSLNVLCHSMCIYTHFNYIPQTLSLIGEFQHLNTTFPLRHPIYICKHIISTPPTLFF